MANSILGYIERQSLIHRLTGTSKLALVIAFIVAAAITFDARLLLACAIANIALWALARMKLRDMKVVLILIGTFMILNNLLIFAFEPTYGTTLFGSSHLIADGPGRWDLTWEQLFYQALVTLKYFAVLPAVLVFVGTTPPSEFAASLNSIGLPYRFSYSVALALRFIPDIQREFKTVSLAQQARGLDVSRKVGLATRIRNVSRTLMPLLLGTFDRIETIAAAMELRGFGRNKTRTWLSARSMKAADWVMILLGIGIILAAIGAIQFNGGRFWNPFS
ncbi:energy-coupling factor transporter transmembrane component T family protein [Trueperella pecoris]|uniref:energy-coupling factor transporter transmembrane component T family protein n=1 Tax=Trueperella pecoris TaxID=2733571 RepID=UPI0021004775|nr:energy-coupling factor transporter transmembrane component T [Trueperella pecoris]